MRRTNEKRNNRRNRQRNNGNDEASKFASIMMGAIMVKAFEEVFGKNAEETPDIHAEGISNQDVTNINNGKATLSKLRIPADGSAVEYPIPDNLQFFFAEDGKLMVRRKIEGDAEAPSKEKEKPITYDDVCKKLFLDNKTYWLGDKQIRSISMGGSYYKDINNCTSEAQAKRLLAYNKLMNIAKYLNGDWKPNFKDYSKKWSIRKYICYGIQYSFELNEGSVYFKSADLAGEAILLMGKESLDNLFSTDW